VAYYKGAASHAQCGPSAAEVAFRLGCTSRPDASGNYACRCPCDLHKHGDRSPSLSVKDGRDGRVLLFCHAGGNYRDVRAALVRLGVLPARARP
jgi:hypothetical protein